MISWLASYPRSGNSLAQIALKHFFQIQTRTVYADRWCIELGEVPLDKDLEEVARAAEPCFVKTHEMPAGDDYPAIYVVRDGRDALVSYTHFVLHTEYGIPAGQDQQAFLRILRELILSDNHFGGWSRNVLAWKRRARTAVLRYEDLLVRPADLLRNALTAIGQRPSVKAEAPLPSFEKLHEAFPWFFRKGRTGAWRTEMPEALHKLFWDRHGEAMAALDYQRGGSDPEGVPAAVQVPAYAATVLSTASPAQTTEAAPPNPDSATSSNISGPGLANFFSDPYQMHNQARLAHLESLGLPLAGRRVLELGSGPGDHTGFYVERHCTVVSVDARQDCLAALKRRYPGVQTMVCDLNTPARLAELGSFDVIHCYGILYHLEDPGPLVAYIGQACSGLAIVETCVLPGDGSRMNTVDETIGDYTQSSTGRGCRPTRRWVFEELRRFFPFVYNTRTQPNHPEFPVNWNVLTNAPPLVRSVFVASKQALNLPSLSPELLSVQERLDTTAYIATLESESAINRRILLEREELITRLHAGASDLHRRAEALETAAAERLQLLEAASRQNVALTEAIKRLERETPSEYIRRRWGARNRNS